MGATLTRGGVNFAVFSRHATRVELALFDSANGAPGDRFELTARTGDIWHGWLPGRFASEGTAYAYFVHGPFEPGEGHRFDGTAPLIDPYARRLSRGESPRSVIVDGRFKWNGDRAPAIAWRDTVLYELHVKGFTALHPLLPPPLRGKYLGLAAIPVIDHLKSLGVTAVELLPCQAFVSEHFLQVRGLKNYWGYNPLAWFAPANDYAVDDPVVEFKTMVKALHAARIEVILDVVFNHTAEGNEGGPVLSFKGFDNSVYYRLLPDPRHYDNVTGCGNTVNCEHPRVRELIIDCLKYWVEEMHVDGFRFDLATVLARESKGFNAHAAFFDAVRAEPLLEGIKLIAEPWDVGWGGYQLGRFPPGWSEWNDRFRDTVRSFWRRDAGRSGELAERIAGSSDLFRHAGRRPTASVNFVTAHDGFTLFDLVSYQERRNEKNLENNADGTSHNLSWNCGAEGPTEDPWVLALRRRQAKNLLATLLLAQGVPMLQAGDEFGRTQGGNNNAYCQDNEISWVDWRLCETNRELKEFVELLLRLRREHPEFRRETFLKGTSSRSGIKDVSWLHPRGGEMTHTDWQDSELRSLGMLLGKRGTGAHRLLLLLHAGAQAESFALPAAGDRCPWRCRFDTARPEAEGDALILSGAYTLAANGAALLEC